MVQEKHSYNGKLIQNCMWIVDYQISSTLLNNCYHTH